jgi:hypothetical protein
MLEGTITLLLMSSTLKLQNSSFEFLTEILGLNQYSSSSTAFSNIIKLSSSCRIQILLFAVAAARKNIRERKPAMVPQVSQLANSLERLPW